MKDLIVKPEDKINFDKILEDVLTKIKKGFDKEEPNQTRYHIVIQGEYPRVVLDKVEELYREMKWSTVSCKTSSEKGERGGLTGLIVYTQLQF